MIRLSQGEDRARKQCSMHLLPFRIHNDGPVDASPRYWAPELANDGNPEAYFRGRKLKGREIEVPQGYRGVVAKEVGKEKTAILDTEKADFEGGTRDDGDEEQEEITVLNEVGLFNNAIVWNHESMVNGDDVFVKGLSEFIGFAETIHGPAQEKALSEQGKSVVNLSAASSRDSRGNVVDGRP